MERNKRELSEERKIHLRKLAFSQRKDLKRDWGSAMIWLFYIFFDLYGWREWKRDEKIL
jgi:hypothetical protein